MPKLRGVVERLRNILRPNPSKTEQYLRTLEQRKALVVRDKAMRKARASASKQRRRKAA